MYTWKNHHSIHNRPLSGMSSPIKEEDASKVKWRTPHLCKGLSESDSKLYTNFENESKRNLKHVDIHSQVIYVDKQQI